MSKQGRNDLRPTFDADAPEALMEALALNRRLAVRWVEGDIVVEMRGGTD